MRVTMCPFPQFEGRVCATCMGIRVIPTRWLDVSEEDVKRSEYRSRLCWNRVKRWDRILPRMFVMMRSLHGAHMTVHREGKVAECVR